MTVKVFKHKAKGRWRCVVREPGGKRRTLSVGLPDTASEADARRAAEAVQRRVWAEAYQPERPKPIPKYKLQDALVTLIKSKRAAGASDGTLDFVATKGDALIATFGNVDVNTITVAKVESYVVKRSAAKRSLLTIRHELSVLGQVVRHARKLGKYNGPDPRDLMPAELRGAYKPRERWLTPAEAVELFEALEPEWRDAFTLAVETGARASELFGLAAADVDEKHRTLRIRGTKTRGADRVVPLSDAALRATKQLPLAGDYDGFYRALGRACERCGPVDPGTGKPKGIEPVSLNDLRRTFASSCANAGVPELQTARMMGHTSSTMVRKVYAQIEPRTFHDAMAAVARYKAEAIKLAEAKARDGAAG